MNAVRKYRCKMLIKGKTISSVSAVFLIAVDGKGKVLAIKNERGWDIPGGHVEKGETLKEALRREVRGGFG